MVTCHRTSYLLCKLSLVVDTHVGCVYILSKFCWRFLNVSKIMSCVHYFLQNSKVRYLNFSLKLHHFPLIFNFLFCARFSSNRLVFLTNFTEFFQFSGSWNPPVHSHRTCKTCNLTFQIVKVN